MNYPGAKGEGSQPRSSLLGKQQSKTKLFEALPTPASAHAGSTKLLFGRWRRTESKVAAPLP